MPRSSAHRGKGKVVGQPQATHVSIAVGDNAEREGLGENFQSGLHLRENLHLMAAMQKDFKALVGQLLSFVGVVASIFKGVKQHAASQCTDPVLERRVFVQQA
ncbi:hypothetical protein TOC8171_33430 [Pseudomonas syringae]